ncbi:hypothetical protein MICA_118 [Micavibrio aeruginosavorus ARL-13]|uniref:Peptidase S74 domain-containing protein n=1 Tax=Micavibrio aeruginosavorus (strain ARL-13) TaxID=856793 RepID=G2KMS8_MICAA|nr:hypothetical protein MICA_118 [Micavibrio aeruginosavorus ARL-13]
MRFYALFPIFLWALLSFFPIPALAAEAQPGDSCSVNGEVRQTGGPEQIPSRTLICNGTTWQNALEQSTAGTSLLQIGNDATSCTTEKLGRLRYNGVSTWSFCNGTAWVSMGAAAISSLTPATASNTINNANYPQTWTWDGITSSPGLSITSSTATGRLLSVAITTASSSSAAIYGTNSGNGYGATGVYGRTSSTSDVNYGVQGHSDSPTGYGVYAYAASNSGTNYGLYALSNSSTGYAIYCFAVNTYGCGGNRAWSSASDRRLKKEITPLGDKDGLEAIMQLRPVRYHWRDVKSAGKAEMGFIAQDVEPILPELVGYGPDTEITMENGTKEVVRNAKSMSYSTVVVPLVKAVQELKIANDVLRTQNTDLRHRVERLESAEER